TASADRDLSFLSATELVEKFRNKSLSPVEATAAILRRIERLEPKLNAFTLRDPEGALKAARASEARWQKGEPLGLLDGVPVTIKDLFLTRGWPTLRGSTLIDRDQPWEEDAPPVARLRETGAVFLGKTTMPEFGWKALGDSPLSGISRNPWNLEHTPGGSSTGAAAAIAAGLGPVGLGTDGGGSIRIPCSFTGTPGLKPTFGRVPAYPASPFGLLAHTGPMARTVQDCALLLNVLTGADIRDPYALPRDGTDYRTGLEDGIKGLRIAYSATLGYAGNVHKEVAAAVERAAKTFSELGAEVDAVDPGFDDPRAAWLTLWYSGAAKALGHFNATQRKRLDPGLLVHVERGEKLSAMDFLTADIARTDLGRQMNIFHQRYDLLITPSTAVPALKVGTDLYDPAREKEWIDWTPFSYPFNLTRQPAASVPCGLTSAGLPIGLQIVGRLYADALVLRAARAFERSYPAPRPALD
ncbi:MAG TPA: amidase, partial [Stellaceae bacterium]|nr:amidase [Stellaceae bacterium]